MRNSIKLIAEKYVKDQIRIMKKHGSDPGLDKDQYQRLVTDVENSFRKLGAEEAPVRTRTTRQAVSNSRTLQT